jgi:hypothetical protein
VAAVGAAAAGATDVGATESFVIVDVVPWTVEVTPDGVVTFVVVLQVLFTNWQAGAGVEVVVGIGVTTPTRGTVGLTAGTEIDGTNGTTGAETTGTGAGGGTATVGTVGTGTVAVTVGTGTVAVTVGTGTVAVTVGTGTVAVTVGTGTEADTEGSGVVPTTVGAGDGVIATVAVPPGPGVTEGTVNPTSCPATETLVETAGVVDVG